MEFFDTLFAGQRRWARDPRSIKRGNRSSIYNEQFNHNSNKGKKMLCLNCEKPGCAIRKCKSRKNYRGIPNNLAAWIRQKGLEERTNNTNIADYIALAVTYEKLLEVMVALVSEGELDPEYYDSGENMLHNNEVEEGNEMNDISSNIDEIRYIIRE